MPTRPPVHRPSYIQPPEVRAAEYEQRRGSPSSRGYGRRWQRLRLAFLAQHPLCVMCKAEDRIVAATVVDHVTPHKGDEALLYAWSNLQPLCHSHHASKTNRDGSRGAGIGRLKR